MEKKEFFVDLLEITDKSSLHNRLREKLSLPSWYGNNLDALYDVLTDMEVPACIHFLGWEKAVRRFPSYMKAFRKVLSDAEKDNPGLSIVFEDLKE